MSDLTDATCAPMTCPLCEDQGRPAHLVHAYRVNPVGLTALVYKNRERLIERVAVCSVHPAWLSFTMDGIWLAEEGSKFTHSGHVDAKVN